MSNLYKYIFVCIGVVLLFISFRYYNLSNEYTKLTIEHTQLQAKYAVEKANTSALENSLKSQNLLIEQFKQSSLDYEATIDRLNGKIDEMNKVEVKYETSNNEQATSEEAIQWLRQKASSLVR
jgi:septal ring factor EnvC (AmiA/AmiB activator)